MYRAEISSARLPVMCGCDFLAASEPFFHADRTAEFNIMIYVTEGVIYVTEGDTDYCVGAGELLFLKSGVRHFGKREIPRGTKWFFAHFFSEDSGLPLFAPDSGQIPPYTRTESSLKLPKYIRGLSGSDIERDISALVEYSRSEDSFKQWYINQRFFMLLSRLALAEYSRTEQPSLADRICGYLAEHRDEPFSADAVSREFYLSYKHLAAVFRHSKGMTMQQYHTSLRMNEACRLLRSTLMQVGEIAATLGYADMLYFSRCFHAQVGCSPSEYRKRTPVY